MRESGERFAPGETVFLLREVRAGRQIHEIGTRAHVLADHGAVIVLHLDGSDAEVVTCPTDTSRARSRGLRARLFRGLCARRFARRWARSVGSSGSPPKPIRGMESGYAGASPSPSGEGEVEFRRSGTPRRARYR